MVRCKVSRNMDACSRYLCTYAYVIVCMSARKEAPVNLLMCPFELYMFIGVSMQLRVVFFSSDPILLVGCPCKKKKKKKNSYLTLIRTASHFASLAKVDGSLCMSKYRIHLFHSIFWVRSIIMLQWI